MDLKLEGADTYTFGFQIIDSDNGKKRYGPYKPNPAEDELVDSLNVAILLRKSKGSYFLHAFSRMAKSSEECIKLTLEV